MSFTIKTSTKAIRRNDDVFEFSLKTKGIKIIKRKMNKLHAINREKLPFTDDSVKVKHKWCSGNNIDEIKLRGEYRIKFEFNHYNFKGYRGWYARIIKARLIEPESESEPDYGEGRDEAELKCVEGNNETKSIYVEGRDASDLAQLGINDCPICTEEIKGGPYTTECAHTFHTVCIKKWINGGDNRKCPVCRQETGIRREVNDVENKINNDVEGKIDDDVGYNQRGFDRNHMHYNGTRYNDRGFDYRYRYMNGTLWNNNGYDFWGYDRDGFDINHMHENGAPYNNDGFNYEHMHKNGTRYDDDGFSWAGLDSHGVDRRGFRKLLCFHFHVNGGQYDPHGFDHKGIYRNGSNRDEYGFNYKGAHINGTHYNDDGKDWLDCRRIRCKQALHNSNSKRKHTRHAMYNKRYAEEEVSDTCPLYK